SPSPAALIVVLDPIRRSLPGGLAQRCADSGIALLSAPPATSPERVEEVALNGLLEAASGGLELLTSVQRYLLTALAGPKPEREVLDKVNRLSGVSLALLTPWGETVARAGSRVGRLAAGDLEGRPEGRLQLASGPAMVV